MTGGFLFEAGEAGFGLREFRLGNTPFGLDPCLSGSGLRLRQFGGARCCLGTFQRKRDGGPGGFVFGALCLAGGKFAFQPGEGLCCVMGQPVGIAAILFEPQALAFKIGKSLLGGFKLAGERGHAVAVGAGIVAAVGQGVAHFGERLGGGMLSFLRRLGLVLRGM